MDIFCEFTTFLWVLKLAVMHWKAFFSLFPIISHMWVWKVPFFVYCVRFNIQWTGRTLSIKRICFAEKLPITILSPRRALSVLHSTYTVARLPEKRNWAKRSENAQGYFAFECFEHLHTVYEPQNGNLERFQGTLCWKIEKIEKTRLKRA